MPPGWNQAFPAEYGLTAGKQHLYADPRILWALEQMGIVEGKRVLEIGPLEAGHTYLIDQHHPAQLHAIEANKLSFLRCLVVKEILKLKHAEFMLGDAQLWLEETDHVYDLILASGVLYHMQEPLRLLQAMGSRSNNCLSGRITPMTRRCRWGIRVAVPLSANPKFICSTMCR